MKLPVVDDAVTGFPPLHAAWAKEAFGSIPRESLSTCDACPMLPEPGQPVLPEHFNPATKCCSYIPRLSNFLVGGLVGDEDPAIADGRARVRDRIAKRIAVTPLGVLPPSHFDVLYVPGSGNFGHAESLRCPYYAEASGGCTVWKHRNGICTTWFCKHGRGHTARFFWKTLAALFLEAEAALVRHCVLSLDVGDEALRALYPLPNEERAPVKLDDMDGRVDEPGYRRAWGKWLGREEAFYLACRDLVRPLSWDDVRAIGGAPLRMRERIAQGAYAAIASTELPPRARVAPFTVAGIGPGSVRVVGYSPFDPVDLPAELMTALACFDGAPLPEARARLVEEHGLELDDDLVRKLIDFGLLEAD
jgi:hypothetical protein